MTLLACFLAAACSGAASVNGPDEPGHGSSSVSSVQMTPSEVTVEKGNSSEVSLTVTLSDGSSAGRSGSWEVDDSTVLRVDGTGSTRQVVGLATGSARVIGTLDGVADTVDVAVKPPGNQGGGITQSPNPSAGDTILLDTRENGPNSIQGPGISTLEDANSAAEVATFGAEPFAFTTDFDGSGTNAWVARYRAVNGNYGDRRAFIQFKTQKTREVYVQWKQWMGRRSGDGVGWGLLNSFDFTNPNDPVGNASRKNLRAVGTDWSGNNALWTGSMPGPEPVPLKLFDEQNFNVISDGSWTPEALENSKLIFTYRIKCESAKGAGDGELETWLEQDGRIIAHAVTTNINMNCETVHEFNVGLMMRSPIENVSEYFWDIVAWSGS